MSHIIAGRFESKAGADAAIEALGAASFPTEHMSCFYVGPPGQHARFAIGGDHNVSRGAEEGSMGAMTGTAAGGAVGAAIGSVGGPLGFLTGGLVGAHIGNLIGALRSMHENEEDRDPSTALRHSGFIVAVCADDENREHRAMELLMQCGAAELETGEGHIEHGDWQDFDPAEAPHRVMPDQDTGTRPH